uniref:Uncharacterized protein n=1 Tax=Romanomermis culicivorax TaxID=13658 RepID=A0A915HJT8_ROMCU
MTRFIVARWSNDSTTIYGAAPTLEFVVFSFHDCERSIIYISRRSFRELSEMFRVITATVSTTN